MPRTRATELLADGALGAWLTGAGIPLAGRPRLTLIAGGRSNLTYRMTDDAGHEYVLRRPPTGGVLPSAHDVGREFRIISALAGTRVPVPRALGLCTDDAVIGAPFYVMNLVPGAVVAGDEDGARYPVEARGRASRDLIDVLAEIHLVDVDEVGLGELSRRESYCERQLRRWLRQFRVSTASTTRSVPLIEELHDRLAACVPPQRHTGLVHGDFRPGNLLLSPQGRINAVLDWELATLGDTLADVGWLVATWREPGEVELLESPAAQPGFADRGELLVMYAARTGRDVSDIPWYQAFALWRLACISEGIYARYSGGVMGDDGFDAQAEGRHVIQLAEAARDAFARL
ncbi:phosphotransferase family protein [Dactylosporangium sp. NPDC048998]|uniref:phosphotransferase family protein n=1 Tax=Dactylosporangium sp. NPDC048998 TaxID=3363976 RepID=UPI0037230DC4